MSTRESVWAMYFASMASIKRHPGNHQQEALRDIAYIADKMLELHEERWPCQHGQQQQSSEET